MVATEPYLFTYDAIMFIDVSFPEPKTLEWILPDDDRIVVNQMDRYRAELVFTGAGEYEIGMRVTLDGCVSEVFRKLLVQEGNGGNSNQAREEDKEGLKVRVSPNPTSGMLNVLINSKLDGDILLQLVSPGEGRKVYTARLSGHKDYLHEIDTEGYTSGTYILLVRQEDKTITKNLVIVK